MNKLFLGTIITFGMILLLSCQGGVSQAPPPQINTLTTLPPFLTSSGTGTPINTLTPLTESTSNIFSVNFNFIPELSGVLYLNPNGASGNYFDLDFDDHQVFQHQLPDGCQLLSTGKKAICEVKVDPGGTEVFVYDVATRQRDSFLGQTLVYRWGISGSQRYIIYILNEVEEGGMPIYSYDIATKKMKRLGFSQTFMKYCFRLIFQVQISFLLRLMLKNRDR